MRQIGDEFGELFDVVRGEVRVVLDDHELRLLSEACATEIERHRLEDGSLSLRGEEFVPLMSTCLRLQQAIIHAIGSAESQDV